MRRARFPESLRTLRVAWEETVTSAKLMVRSMMPDPAWQAVKKLYWKSMAVIGHRPQASAETTKARPRRLREGFFDLYCQGKGLDIGYGGDPVTPGCNGWDFEDGDAQYLPGLRDESFDFVYASHTIEHMVDPAVALQNWWRVVKRGGYLLLYIPHRDLYEKRTTLPSRWNHDHKHFFLVDRDEAPDTLGMKPLFERSLHGYDLVYLKECSEGHTITDPLIHSDGEFSIEAVLRKL
jgi:SAM-dependent methyltransferase